MAHNGSNWLQRILRSSHLGSCVILVSPLIFIAAIVISSQIELLRPTHYSQPAKFSYPIPESATDIRRTRTVPFDPTPICFQFQCSHHDFEQWVANARIKDARLSELVENSKGMRPHISQSGQEQHQELGRHLMSEWRFEDQGHYYLYDFATGTAVRWRHTR